MRWLIRFTLKETVLINLLFVVMMVAGSFAMFSLPVERYPNISMAKVIVQVIYPGASPEEVESLVTKKLEESLDDLPHVEFTRSTSYRQRSNVVVKFVDDTDYDRGYDELRFRVLGQVGELPAEVDPPTFNVIDVNDWLPAVSVNLVGDRSNRSLVLMAKELKIALRQIPGVREVKLQGEQKREFHVLLDPARLTRYGITFDQASTALGQSGVGIPAGDFTTRGGEFVIKADERFKSRTQVLDAIVRTDADGSFVRIRDLASDAKLAYRDAYALASVNGRDCVTLSVIKTKQGNAIDIVDGVRDVLEQFKPALTREGVETVLTQNSTVAIGDAMDTLGWNLAVGVFLVCVVIALFMGVRNAAITTVGIPFSFLFTMVLMYVTGNSLNEITLFSFVLVSGIIVDDAIVVVENIYRHLQEGDPMDRAVVEGTAEVFWPVVSATATTVAAFLPMLIMTGSTGEFFALIPKAVSFALAASLFECMIILPLHYKDFGPKKGIKRIEVEELDFSSENRVMAAVRRLMTWGLTLCLRFRWLTLLSVFLALVLAIAVAFVSAAGIMPLIKVKFFPDDYSLYMVDVTAPVTWPIERTNAFLKEVSREVMKEAPGKAESTVAVAGFYISEDYEAVFGSNLGHVAVTLPAKDVRRFDDYPTNSPPAHLDYMREKLKPFNKDGVRIKIKAMKDGPPSGKDINVRVVGSSPDSVAGLAEDIKRYLAEGQGLTGQLIDLEDSTGQPSRVFRYRVIPERAAEYGLTPDKVVYLAASLLNGRYAAKYRLVDEEVDLKVKLDPAAVASPEQALAAPLVEHPSGPVRLGDLVDTQIYVDTGYLNRFQGERSVTVTANLKTGSRLSTPTVIQMIQTHYKEIRDRYPGASLNFAGEFASTRNSYTSLLYAFGIALLLIYLILATQFKSYLQPVIILSGVVFALIGVIFGKLFTQTLFTVNSFVATVGVTGVVVNDALVLMDFLNRKRREGLPRREALWQAVHIRLRPILLTTLTTTLGLLPMAIGFPEYSIVWGTMAGTFVTGLCTATFLTILVVPVQWDLLEALRERLAARRARKAEKAAAKVE